MSDAPEGFWRPRLSDVEADLANARARIAELEAELAEERKQTARYALRLVEIGEAILGPYDDAYHNSMAPEVDE